MVQDTSFCGGTVTAPCDNWCGYRLPCGYCRVMNGPCIKTGNSPTITWTTSTAQSINYEGKAPEVTL